ncbi:acyl-CoA synthetase [Alteromonas macleodii]
MLKDLESQLDVSEFEKVPFNQREVPKTSYEIFKNAAKQYTNNVALEFFLDATDFKKSTQLTYKELFKNINRTANFFRDIGIGREDVIAFVLPNLPETHYVIWGGEAAGIVMSLNPMLEAEHLASLLSTAQAKYLVALAPSSGSDIWEKCVKASKSVESLQGIIAVDMSHYVSASASPIGKVVQPSHTTLLADLPALNFNDECKKYSGDSIDFSPPKASDIASYFCTGGTTGLPKVAKRSHSSESYNAWAMTKVFQSVFTESLSIFCGLPLFHVNGQIVTGLAPWSQGAKVVLGTPQGYRANDVVVNFWKIVEHYRVNLFSGVPTLFASLQTVPLKGEDITSLKKAICGAAPLPKELFKQFTKKTNIPLVEGYGLTEGACASSLNPGKSMETVGSIGFRIPYQDMAVLILDNHGNYLREANRNEQGCIAIKGPNVFSGYLDERHNDGIWITRGTEIWLNTGDLGRQDENGLFWLTGRKKELIIRGGHNIDPSVIEEALHAHQSVKLAAAVPRPDAYAGELPVAYVELRDNANVTPEQLRTFAELQISEKAAWPKKITIMDKMPVTSVGKLHKPTLVHLEVESVIRDICKRLNVEVTGISVRQDAKLGMVGVVKASFNSNVQHAFRDEIDKLALNIDIV